MSNVKGIVSVTDGIIIDDSNMMNYLRRYANFLAGKATRGRLSDEVVAKWSAAGFPVVEDTYGSDKRPTVAKVTATADERAQAKLWALDTGSYDVPARGRLADEVIVAWRDAGAPFYETREEYGRVIGYVRTKSGKWSTKETVLVGFKNEQKLTGSMATRIVTAALTESGMVPDDIRMIRVESATGRKWTVDYTDNGIEFNSVTVVSELLAQFGTVIEPNETE